MKVEPFKIATTLLLSLITLKLCSIESELEKQNQNPQASKLHRFYKEYQESVNDCSKTLTDAYENYRKLKIDPKTETMWEFLKSTYDTESYIKQHCESRHKYWLEN